MCGYWTSSSLFLFDKIYNLFHLPRFFYLAIVVPPPDLLSTGLYRLPRVTYPIIVAPNVLPSSCLIML